MPQQPLKYKEEKCDKKERLEDKTGLKCLRNSSETISVLKLMLVVVYYIKLLVLFIVF